MTRGGFGAIRFVSAAMRAACLPAVPVLVFLLALAALLFGAPPAQAASGDVSDRAAQARTLLDTPQGAALLDLLGDPAVRQQLLTASTPSAPHAVPTNSMGRALD